MQTPELYNQEGGIVVPLRGKEKEVNWRYFRQKLETRKLSQAEVARRMHMSPSMISLGFRGKRTFSTDQHVQLAKILSVPLEEVLQNLGIEAPHRALGGQVAVTGEITTAGEVVRGTPAGPRFVDAPPHETGEGLEALRYTGPGPLDGAYIYFRASEGVATEAIGRPCICALADGRTLFATPSLGAIRGSYTLRDWAGHTVAVDARLKAASPVAWIKVG